MGRWGSGPLRTFRRAHAWKWISTRIFSINSSQSLTVSRSIRGQALSTYPACLAHTTCQALGHRKSLSKEVAACENWALSVRGMWVVALTGLAAVLFPDTSRGRSPPDLQAATTAQMELVSKLKPWPFWFLLYKFINVCSKQTKGSLMWWQRAQTDVKLLDFPPSYSSNCHVTSCKYFIPPCLRFFINTLER